MTYQCDQDKGRELEYDGAAISDKRSQEGSKACACPGENKAQGTASSMPCSRECVWSDRCSREEAG